MAHPDTASNPGSSHNGWDWVLQIAKVPLQASFISRKFLTKNYLHEIT